MYIWGAKIQKFGENGWFLSSSPLMGGIEGTAANWGKYPLASSQCCHRGRVGAPKSELFEPNILQKTKTKTKQKTILANIFSPFCGPLGRLDWVGGHGPVLTRVTKRLRNRKQERKRRRRKTKQRKTAYKVREKVTSKRLYKERQWWCLLVMAGTIDNMGAGLLLGSIYEIKLKFGWLNFQNKRESFDHWWTKCPQLKSKFLLSWKFLWQIPFTLMLCFPQFFFSFPGSSAPRSHTFVHTCMIWCKLKSFFFSFFFLFFFFFSFFFFLKRVGTAVWLWCHPQLTPW